MKIKEIRVGYTVKENKARAFIEINTNKDGKTKGGVGMITLIPSLPPSLPPSQPSLPSLPPSPSPSPSPIKFEFIFIIDQSGSMSRIIPLVIDCLHLFLRSLPLNCTFNLIGFGSTAHSLFDQPMELNQKNFKIGSEFIDRLKANLGGTEIGEPFKLAFSTELANQTMRNIFLLTDGRVANEEKIFKLIEENREETNDQTRIFSLGIGDYVSKSLLNGIARSGNGSSYFIPLSRLTSFVFLILIFNFF